MLVSIAVVAFNEEDTLPELLQDICRQDYPHELLDILLIDSGSTDSTKLIMQRFAEKSDCFFRVAVLDNPGRILPSGCNVALKNYLGEAIVRIDAHARIPSDFIRNCVCVLETGEMVCGGPRPNIIDAQTPWKKTLLTAEQSMFGSGFASYRSSDKKQYVSSVFHGMYRRQVYDTVGLYNEKLTRTEDNDMSWRIRQAGYRICYDPSIVSYQHTRNSLKRMLQQKYLNGYWIGKTMGINPRCFSMFHFIPFAFVLAIAATGGLALFGCPFWGILMWCLYTAVVVLITVAEQVREFSFEKFALPFLFLALHLTYGVGTMIGLLSMLKDRCMKK